MNCYETDLQDDIDGGPGEADADLMDDDRIELVRCPSCGKMINEFAQQCPYCKDWIIATEQSGPFRSRAWWWITLAGIGIAMFILYYAM